jgi:hypothetical protein
VFFDNLHEELNLIKGSTTVTLHHSVKTDKSWKSCQLKLPHGLKLTSAKVSPDYQLAAVRIADKEVKVCFVVCQQHHLCMSINI